jgi:hypothetical protein
MELEDVDQFPIDNVKAKVKSFVTWWSTFQGQLGVDITLVVLHWGIDWHEKNIM